MARLLVLGLLAFVSSALCEHDVLMPRHNQLKPRPLHPSLIPGLLHRASSECATCGIGGVCCSGGDCCGTAQRCCSDGGCCQITESCVTVFGVKGCCPVGATCTPPGKTSKTASSSATSTQSALSSLPTPTTGSQDVVVDVSTAALGFSGQWKSTTSSCNSSATAKTVSSDGVTAAEFSEVSYTFKGSAIFLKFASLNARYTIDLDFDTTEYGSGVGLSAAPLNCTYGWWRDNLDTGVHFLTISVYGVGANSTALSARAAQPFAFELQNFIITQLNTASSSSSSPTSTLPSSSGSGSGSSSGSGLGSGSSGNAVSTTAGLSYLASCLMFGLWAAFLR